MNEEHLDALHIRQLDEITRMKVENSVMKKQLYYLKKIPVREEKLLKQVDSLRKMLHSSGYKEDRIVGDGSCYCCRRR